MQIGEAGVDRLRWIGRMEEAKTCLVYPIFATDAQGLSTPKSSFVTDPFITWNNYTIFQLSFSPVLDVITVIS